jgi:hypothetical protein
MKYCAVKRELFRPTSAAQNSCPSSWTFCKNIWGTGAATAFTLPLPRIRKTATTGYAACSPYARLTEVRKKHVQNSEKEAKEQHSSGKSRCFFIEIFTVFQAGFLRCFPPYQMLRLQFLCRGTCSYLFRRVSVFR